MKAAAPGTPSAPASPMIRPAAGIVAFGPDPAAFRRLIAVLKPQAAQLFVAVNGLIEPSLARELEADPSVDTIVSPVNLGIGEALNLLALAAILAGHRELVLFDQDSTPPPDLLGRLAAGFAGLRAAGERPAAIAPLLVSPPGASHKPPRYKQRRARLRRGDLAPVDFLPTSGTLIDLDAFRRIGTFRADYFIDAIDLEWCFRAWSAGFSCWLHEDAPMVHTIGSGILEAPWLRLSMPRQRLFRMASYIRNNVYGFRLAHVPLGWKLRQLAYLPVQAALVWADSGFDRAVLANLGRAARDGIAGRLGPPPDAPFTGDGSRPFPPRVRGGASNTGP